MKKVIILIFLTNILYSQNIYIKTFGTIGTVYNDNENYEFRKNSLQKGGSSKDINFEADTLIGLQISSNINENNSLVFQTIAQKDHNGDNNIDIDWGYLRYDSSDNYIFKIGRIRTPYYKNSDNLNVGYSNLMIREPIEVYGQVPFSAYDGIELSYSDLLGGYLYSSQANYGKEKFVAPIHSLGQNVDVTLDDLYALNFTIGNSYAQFRATYLNANISASNQMLDQLFSGLKKAGFNSLAKEYELKDKNSEYLGFGLFIEYDNFILNSEYGQRKIPSFYGDMKGAYLTLGYSIDRLITFATFAKNEITQEININSISNELNVLMAIQNVEQTTKTLGLKYYINGNFDIKVQYDHIEPNGLQGSFYVGKTPQPSTLNIISVALDFIF